MLDGLRSEHTLMPAVPIDLNLGGRSEIILREALTTPQSSRAAAGGHEVKRQLCFIIASFALLVALPCSSQSYYDFRGSNWGDDIPTIVRSEGADYRSIDGFRSKDGAGSEQFISLKDRGYWTFEYRRNMLGEAANVYYLLSANRLVAALYSLKFDPQTRDRLISSLQQKYGPPSTERRISLTTSMDAHPLALVEDYDTYRRAGKSIIGQFERSADTGHDTVFYEFKTPVSIIYVVSQILRDTIVVLYVERKDNF